MRQTDIYMLRFEQMLMNVLYPLLTLALFTIIDLFCQVSAIAVVILSQFRYTFYEYRVLDIIFQNFFKVIFQKNHYFRADLKGNVK